MLYLWIKASIVLIGANINGFCAALLLLMALTTDGRVWVAPSLPPPTPPHQSIGVLFTAPNVPIYEIAYLASIAVQTLSRIRATRGTWAHREASIVLLRSVSKVVGDSAHVPKAGETCITHSTKSDDPLAFLSCHQVFVTLMAVK